MNFKDLARQERSLLGHGGARRHPLNITGGTGNPDQIFGEMVTGNYFTVLGRAAADRTRFPAR
jgi:hypothetical protein